MTPNVQPVLAETIPEAVLEVARRLPDAPALHDWQEGAWHPLTFGQLAAALLETAGGLARLGIQPDDRVALLGPNCPAWGIAYLGILAAGGIVVPLDRMQTASEWLATIQASEPVAVIAAGEEAPHLKPELVHARSVRQLIALTGAATEPELTLTQVQSLAAQSETELPVPRKPGDLASLIFTSGTTGPCKGVMLSHRNILHDAKAMLQVFDIRFRQDRFLSVLPLSHCYECTAGFLSPLLAGASIYYARGLAATEVIEDLRSSQATFLLGVPLLYEKVTAGLQRGLRKRGGLAAGLGSLLWSVSRSGRSLWKHRFGRLTLGGIRREAGLSNIRYLISGGAPLPAEVGNSLQALGLKFIQGYGLTETAPVLTLNPYRGAIPNSVGFPLPGVELKIHEPDFEGKGEIWVKGPNITRGYWQDPEGTEDAFEDGWFKTGDLGRLDADGHLYITGRSKHLIVTSGGKNISPEEVETAARRSPFIAEIIVYGAPAKDGVGESIAAQVYPDHDYIKEWAKASGAAYDLKSLIRKELDRTGEALAHYKRIVRFEIADEPFKKTSSHKIKRHLHNPGNHAGTQD